MIVLGFALIVLSFVVASFGRDDVERARNEARGAGVIAAGVLALSGGLAVKARERVDELWREFDAHVRTCPCMTREWTPEVEAEGERNVERHEAQHAGGVR